MTDGSPKLIAIAGGSGAGKSWLADRLQALLGKRAARLSLDDFYRDRSPLPPKRRAQINFDHPRAIDWPLFERTLRACRNGCPALLPCYDFETHTRQPGGRQFKPEPLVLVDGLWLLRRPSVRKLFALRIYVDCPERVRLRRRLARDSSQRGRDTGSIRKQFTETVSPMHERFVAPQKRWADLVLEKPPAPGEINALAQKITALLND